MNIQNRYNISVLSFKVWNSNTKKQVYSIPFNGQNYGEYTEAECIISLPPTSLLDNIHRLYFYSSIIDTNKFDINSSFLTLQELETKVNQIPSSGLLRLNFDLSIPAFVREDGSSNLSSALLSLSASTTPVNTEGFDKALNDGNFFNTIIPCEDSIDGQ